MIYYMAISNIPLPDIYPDPAPDSPWLRRLSLSAGQNKLQTSSDGAAMDEFGTQKDGDRQVHSLVIAILTWKNEFHLYFIDS